MTGYFSSSMILFLIVVTIFAIKIISSERKQRRLLDNEK